jgi:hypothetical protein
MPTPTTRAAATLAAGLLITPVSPAQSCDPYDGFLLRGIAEGSARQMFFARVDGELQLHVDGVYGGQLGPELGPLIRFDGERWHGLSGNGTDVELRSWYGPPCDRGAPLIAFPTASGDDAVYWLCPDVEIALHTSDLPEGELVEEVVLNGARYENGVWSDAGLEYYVSDLSPGQIFEAVTLDEPAGPAIYFRTNGGDPDLWRFVPGQTAEGVDLPEVSGDLYGLAVADLGGGEALFTVTDVGGGLQLTRLRDGAAEVIPGVLEFLFVHPTRRVLRTLETPDGPMIAALNVDRVIRPDGTEAPGPVAVWDGTRWEGLGGGLAVGGATQSQIWDVLAADLGEGPTFYATGRYLDLSPGGGGRTILARLDGGVWVDALAEPITRDADDPAALIGFDLEALPGADVLVLAGAFDRYGGRTLRSLAAIDAQGVATALGGDEPTLGASSLFGDPVAALVSPNGDAEVLVAEDDLRTGGDIRLHGVGVFSGDAWRTPDDDLLDATVNAIDVRGDGPAQRTLLGGRFDVDGWAEPWRVVQWDGVSLSPVGAAALPNGSFDADSVAWHDDGSGAGATAFAAEGTRVYRNDGGVWTQATGLTPGAPQALFDGGIPDLVSDGALLHAFGAFDTVDGAPAGGWATWDGAAWSDGVPLLPDPQSVEEVRLVDRGSPVDDRAPLVAVRRIGVDATYELHNLTPAGPTLVADDVPGDELPTAVVALDASVPPRLFIRSRFDDTILLSPAPGGGWSPMSLGFEGDPVGEMAFAGETWHMFAAYASTLRNTDGTYQTSYGLTALPMGWHRASIENLSTSPTPFPEGTPITVSFDVVGDGSYTFRWLDEDGAPLPEGGRFSGVTTPALTVDPPVWHEQYVCHVEGGPCGERLTVRTRIDYGCRADIYTGDGLRVVNVDDFAALAAQFGTPGFEDEATRSADLNADGIVDVFDFAELTDDFGCTAP